MIKGQYQCPFEKHLDIVEIGLLRELTAMKLHQFNGFVLYTQRFTEIDACDSFNITETQTPTVIFCPLFFEGILRYISYLTIHYVKKIN